MSADTFGGLYLFGAANVIYLHTTRFWAERGFINWEDSVTDEAGKLTWQTALERIKEVRKMYGTTSKQGLEIDNSDRSSKLKFCEDMLMLIKRAQEQGAYDDPTCYHHHEILRPKTFILSGA